MASILPPTPQGVPPGHAFWNVWYEKLRTVINSIATSIAWVNLNFAGSKIEDIVSRDHNKLTSIQGGTTAEYYHLTNAEHTAIGSLPLNSMAGDPTTSDIPSGYSKLYKNTSTSTIKLWVNDSGTLKSVTLT